MKLPPLLLMTWKISPSKGCSSIALMFSRMNFVSGSSQPHSMTFLAGSSAKLIPAMKTIHVTSEVLMIMRDSPSVSGFSTPYSFAMSAYMSISGFVFPLTSNRAGPLHFVGSQMKVPRPLPLGSPRTMSLISRMFGTEYSTTMIGCLYRWARSVKLAFRSSSVPCHFG